MNFKSLALASAIALSTLSSAAFASPVLWIGDTSNQLGTVDVATGNVNVIGTMSTFMTDIAFDGAGNLYGISFTGLYSINKNTAASTFIGSFGSSAFLNSLVFGPGGTLYGANNSLYSINTGTGAATLIGNGGAAYASSGDLAVVNSQLYLSSSTGGDSLVQLNTSTGAGTLVGSIGYGSVYGLASDNNQDLYGVTGTTILKINTTTGAGSFMVNYSGQGLGFAGGTAFYEEAGASVTEPSALLLLGLGMVGLGSIRTRNKKA